MKRILSVLTLSLSLSAIAGELPEDIQELRDSLNGHMKIWAVKDDDFEDDNDNEFFVLKFESCQDDRDEGKADYLMRVTVQLTDKKSGAVIYAQTSRKPKPLPPDDKYADHTKWEFQIPFGQMKKPKLTGCVIEFGFKNGSVLVPVDVYCDDVDTPEEIMNGEGTRVKMRCTRSTHYWWDI